MGPMHLARIQELLARKQKVLDGTPIPHMVELFEADRLAST